MDTWVLWNLTGGPDGGVHATDVTNASRTMLMDLETLDWHEPSLELMGIPRVDAAGDPVLERAYGEAKGTALGGVPVAGILGDQQAALFGQTCFDAGEAKNTYGTGSFLLVNTGERDRPHRQAADHRGRRSSAPTGRPSTCSRARSR